MDENMIQLELGTPELTLPSEEAVPAVPAAKELTEHYLEQQTLSPEEQQQVEAFSEKYPNLLMLGTGGCNVCKECTYPDNPCRFPKKRISSMEAYGLVVNDVCKANDIPYYYGKDTLTYIGCILFE